MRVSWLHPNKASIPAAYPISDRTPSPRTAGPTTSSRLLDKPVCQGDTVSRRNVPLSMKAKAVLGAMRPGNAVSSSTKCSMNNSSIPKDHPVRYCTRVNPEIRTVRTPNTLTRKFFFKPTHNSPAPASTKQSAVLNCIGVKPGTTWTSQRASTTQPDMTARPSRTTMIAHPRITRRCTSAAYRKTRSIAAPSLPGVRVTACPACIKPLPVFSLWP